MVKHFPILTFLLIAVSCHLGLGASFQQRFKPLPSSDPYPPGYCLYSRNESAPWEEADQDCKQTFGETAHQIYLETHDELDSLSDLFLAEQPDVPFYTGGIYNVTQQQFLWTNGMPIDEDWFPWAAEHPTLRTSEAKLTVTYIPGAGAQFKTVPQTASNLFICEVC